MKEPHRINSGAKKTNDFTSVQAVKILNKYSVGTVNNISFVVWLELKPRGPGELLVFISSPFFKRFTAFENCPLDMNINQ